MTAFSFEKKLKGNEKNGKRWIESSSCSYVYGPAVDAD